MQGRNGSFSTPNWPNNYPNNAFCTWKIVVPEAETVELNFSPEAQTEPNRDFVLVIDSDGSLLAKSDLQNVLYFCTECTYFDHLQ